MSPLPSISPVYSTNRFQRVHPVDKIIGVELLLATDDEDKVNLFALLTRMTFLSVFCAGRDQDIPHHPGTHPN